MSVITMKLIPASQIPASARERLGLAEDSDVLVEVYRCWRPAYDVAIRDETARQMAEAYEREVAKGRG